MQSRIMKKIALYVMPKTGIRDEKSYLLKLV